MPREHGAYFQLVVPVAGACLLHPSWAGAMLAVAAVLGFLAHEPLLVFTGRRGPRLREQQQARARTRFGRLAAIGLVLGGAGLVLAPAALVVAGCVALVAALALALGARGSLHTFGGELVAAFALTGACTPVLVAGGESTLVAIATWAHWAVGFAASVAAVHRVIARHKHPAILLDPALALVLSGATAFAAVVGSPSTPLLGVAALLVLAPPRASRLRAVGIAIAIAATGGVAFAHSKVSSAPISWSTCIGLVR